jgi:Protein of unknown function (DUF2804)
VDQAVSFREADGSARILGVAPTTFLDAAGQPAFGAYAGPLPKVELGPLGLRDRIARLKRWVYGAITTDDVWISFAVVRTGYAATVFAFAYDLAGKRMLVDRTVLGPATVARVADDFHAIGEIAHFQFGKTRVALSRGPHKDGTTTLDVHLRLEDLEVDASIDESVGPRAITAIARLGEPDEGLLNATEKRALLGVKGRARCGAREVTLDGGTAGYDYTHGLLQRHTKWRWAFAQGRSVGGEPFAFNLVQGFVGEAECAAFVGGDAIPLAEPTFHFDLENPGKPWRLQGPGIDLVFAPGAVHSQMTKLVVVRSRFVQPVGAFSGTVRVGGRDVQVAGLPGVVEDQDVLW